MTDLDRSYPILPLISQISEDLSIFLEPEIPYETSNLEELKLNFPLVSSESVYGFLNLLIANNVIPKP